MDTPASPSSHPYDELPPSRFWKSAIAEIDSLTIASLWRPKFPITFQSRIVTAGSCFAQHIRKALLQQGFSWIDAEPAPADLPAELHAAHGYGVFSFRTANIYTAALLKQWLYWTIGRSEASTEVFEAQGRYYDPFRPTIPAEGFASPEDLFAARQVTLAAIAAALRQSDVFIFTLGLTEAWQHKDGYIYPMCPGAVRGRFDSAIHSFHNFTYEEVLRDLQDTFEALRTINPQMRFLLTVSPVPLTATASGEHVLTATTYSKSVLRAVAGYLAQSCNDVDYFPSYELITGTPFKGQFFEANMRSVSRAGVDFVMEQFRRGLASANLPQETALMPAASASMGKTAQSAGDAVCEDIILETWSKAAPPKEGIPRIVLIGDSHMGMIAQALDTLGLPYAGGAIMNGTQWHNLEFVTVEDSFFAPTQEGPKSRWEQTWANSLSRFGPTQRQDTWILTNIGAHSHTFFQKEFGLTGYLKNIHGTVPQEMAANDVLSYLLYVRRRHLSLVEGFVKAGYKVIWITDPPLQPFSQDVFYALDVLLSRCFGAVGCSVFNARDWVNQLGGIPAEFKSGEISPDTGEPEYIHGTAEYYRQLVQQLLNTHPDLAAPRPQLAQEQAPLSSNDAICEDIILESWNKRAEQPDAAAPHIVLIGDSHMGMIAKVLEELGVHYAGGAIMQGTQWHNLEFERNDETFFAPLDAAAKARWNETFRMGMSRPSSPESGKPWVITNIGMHSHVLYGHTEFGNFLTRIFQTAPPSISLHDIANYLMQARQHHLALVRRMVIAGFKVIWLGDPPTQTALPELIANFDSVLSGYFSAIGCSVFNARQWIQRQRSDMPREFKSKEVNPDTGLPDHIHGSDAYYRALVKEVFKANAIHHPGIA